MRFFKLIFSFASLFAFLMFSAHAWAIPVTWTLQNVTFDDGGTAVGSFVFDADLEMFGVRNNSISKINVTTTDSAGNKVASYKDLIQTFAIPGSSFGPSIKSKSELVLLVSNGSIADLTGENAFLLGFGLGLTNTATFNNVGFFSVEGACSTPTCDTVNVQRNVTGGSLTGAPIPEPSTMLLLGSGLVGLAACRWKKRVLP